MRNERRPAAVLSRAEARRLYDRIGRWQDTQSFYEAPAEAALLAHGRFGEARSIFEIGCGTGRLAARLLRTRCRPSARYTGVDLSASMVTAARERLAPYAPRAAVARTDGSFAYERPPGSVDRVVSTYVFDLLSEGDIRAALDEAARLLAPGGRLCLAGLTHGTTPASKAVAAAWSAVQAACPRAVGGCRPVDVRPRLAPERWTVEHHEVVSAWGVPSEVLVARRRPPRARDGAPAGG
jgi:SAM-dependent methyltransferase